ncbi:MAG: bifunctional riboflavin kinase/FAD synthetase [Bacteroidaceae bacterium]
MEIIHNTPNTIVSPCVLTVGFFDGVHVGHQHLINQVKETANRLNIKSGIVTFSKSPKQIIHPEKKISLLNTEEEKSERFADLGIDYCFILDFTPEIANLTAKEFLQNILLQQFNAQHLIIGYDHRFGKNRLEGFKDYKRYGREVGLDVIRATAYIHKEEAISSTRIRTLLNQGKVEEASFCLDVPYRITGKVTDGFKQGRLIGFPTANIKVEDTDKLIPKKGVYAVWAHYKDKIYAGMLNIGKRPTFNNGTNLSIEVHLLNFDNDIYGEILSIDFIKRLRDEQHFDSIELLTAQLHKDKEIIKKLLLS